MVSIMVNSFPFPLSYWFAASHIPPSRRSIIIIMSRHKTQFRQAKKTTNKADALQQKFQTQNKSFVDQDSDIEDDEAQFQDVEANKQESLHSKLTYQYLEMAELEDALISGLRASISGDVIPKNPWCEISRALGDANLRKDIDRTFETLAKNFRKSATVKTKDYNIYKISYNYKQKIKFLNDNNEIEEQLQDRTFEVFGYEQMLEYIFLPRLKEFYFKVQNIIPSFTRELPNGRLWVVNSLSGGYIIKSELIIYPKAHPKDLDIYCECFIDNVSSLESAVEIFAQFIYDDCVAYTNKTDMHIIKNLLIYYFDEKEQEQKKITWKMKNIKVNRNRFIQDVIKNVKARNNIYWKGYCRVQAFEDLDQTQTLLDLKGGRQYDQTDTNNPDAIAYQYIEVYKTYNLHVTINGIGESYSNQPIGSLMKGIFFNEAHAQKYASFFYNKNEGGAQSKYFQSFVRNHLMLVLKKWQEQNIGASAWELFYLAIYIPQIDQRRELMQQIVQIVSSDYSALIQCTKLNNILKMLIEYYEKHQNLLLLEPIILTAYNVYRAQLMQVYGKSNGSDIIRFREFVFRLLRETEDNQGSFQIKQESSLQVLNTLTKITKFTGLGNLQRVGAITHNLAAYIFEALKQNKLLKEFSFYFTYEEFKSLKNPKKMMHVSQEVTDYKLQKDQPYKSNADIEDHIVLTFLNEYQIFDNLYEVLRDLFFGKQLPNPLPTAQFKVEIKALQFQLFEISRKEVYASMCNELNEEQRQDIKDPTKKFYEYITEDMFDLDLKPIYGLDQFLFFAAVFEMSGLKSFLDSYPWQKALKRPLPASYQVQPILSISTIYLFHDADVINRTYGEWSVNWDWIIKGASYAHAQQIFIDTILKYTSWLELATDIMVMGFFTKKEPRVPFLTIVEVLKAEDLTEIKQRLLSKFTEQTPVFFKFIFKIETRFKHINYLINLHYIDPTSPAPQNLLVIEQPENYIKVFYSKAEFMLWNRLYPYSDSTALKLISQAQKQLFYSGTLCESMKLELIKFKLTLEQDQFLTQCRILFSYSESFANFSKEAETFYFLFKYLKTKDEREKPKLQSGQDLMDYFEDFSKALKNDLLAYDNIYFDSIGATVLNYLEYARQAYTNQGTEYDIYAKKMVQVADMCQVICNRILQCWHSDNSFWTYTVTQYFGFQSNDDYYYRQINPISLYFESQISKEGKSLIKSRAQQYLGYVDGTSILVNLLNPFIRWSCQIIITIMSYRVSNRQGQAVPKGWALLWKKDSPLILNILRSVCIKWIVLFILIAPFYLLYLLLLKIGRLLVENSAFLLKKLGILFLVLFAELFIGIRWVLRLLRINLVFRELIKAFDIIIRFILHKLIEPVVMYFILFLLHLVNFGRMALKLPFILARAIKNGAVHGLRWLFKTISKFRSRRLRRLAQKFAIYILLPLLLLFKWVSKALDVVSYGCELVWKALAFILNSIARFAHHATLWLLKAIEASAKYLRLSGLFQVIKKLWRLLLYVLLGIFLILSRSPKALKIIWRWFDIYIYRKGLKRLLLLPYYLIREIHLIFLAVFKEVKRFCKRYASKLVLGLRVLWRLVMWVLKGPLYVIGFVAGIVVAVWEIIHPVIQEIGGFFKSIWTSIQQTVFALLSIFRAVAQMVGSQLVYIKELGNFVIGILYAVAASISEAFTLVKQIFGR